jgi:hexosaminidase
MRFPSNHLVKHTLISFFASLTILPTTLALEKPSIIPQPVEIEIHQGVFSLTAETVIDAPVSLSNESAALRDRIAPATGTTLPIQQDKSTAPQIMLAFDPALKELGEEEYHLQVVNKGVVIRSSTPTGVFYGIQSLLHMQPPQIVSEQKTNADWVIPFITITDQPRFSWRAFMLDEARHFKGDEPDDSQRAWPVDSQDQGFQNHVEDDLPGLRCLHGGKG